MNRKFSMPLAALMVLGLALLAYSNSFNADFHFDDIDKIPNNLAIRTVSNISYFFVSSGDNYLLGEFEFRPVKYSTLALNYYLFGYRLWSYHLFNLVLHLVNCILVFFAVKLVFKAGGRDEKAASNAAFIAASVFALHPLQTSTVMYLSNGRGVMLAGMFYLLSFISFVRFRESGPNNRRSRYAWGLLAPCFYMLGLLSKEIAVTVPALVFVYDLIFTAGKTGGRKGFAKLLAGYIPFAAALALFIVWKQSVHGYAAVRETPYPPVDYLLSEAKAFLLYFRLIFLPFNQNADYFFPATKALDLKSAIGFVAIAVLLGLIFSLRKKEPTTAFFGAWFFILLLPESSFVSFREIAVEYRLYLPLAGFVAAAVSLALNSRVLRDNSVMAARLFAAVLMIFCVLSFARNAVWATETTFWGDAAAKSPWSPRAHANLGRAMLIDKKYPDAATELEKSLEIDPNYRQAGIVHFNLGMCYFETGIMGKAAEQFEAAARAGWDKPETYNKLGETYFDLARYLESAEAYRKALAPGGNNPALQYNLATALMLDDQDDEALEILEGLLEDGFDNYDVRYNLALLYQKRGMRAKSLEHAKLAAGMADDEQGRRNAEALKSP